MSYRTYRALSFAVSCALVAAACSLPKPRVGANGDVAIFAGDPVPRLEFEAPGIAITDSRTSGAGEYVFGDKPGSGFNLSASIEQQMHYGDCIEYHWSRVQRTPGFRAEHVQRREVGELKVIEYVLPESLVPVAPGERIDQKNVIACIRRDWVDAYIHLSKIQYGLGDDAYLDAVLKSVRLVTK